MATKCIKRPRVRCSRTLSKGDAARPTEKHSGRRWMPRQVAAVERRR
jgi:hypothetical protein